MTRRAKNVPKLGAMAEASSISAKETILAINTGLRPNFSASGPKMRAPMGRIISVNVMASVAVMMVMPKSLARFVRQKTRTKKSNASSVQLPTPANNVLRWVGVHAFFGGGPGRVEPGNKVVALLG